MRAVELGSGHDLVHEAEPQRLGGVELLGGEEEFLGLADAELPGLDQELHAGAGHAQDGVGERCVVGGHDQVAHARQHEARRHALALDRRDGGLAEVVDPAAPVDIHDLLVAELALGRLAHGHPVVGSLVADDRLEVMAGAEVLARAGQDHDADVVVGVGAVEAGVEGVDERAVLRVGDLGSVHRERRHRPVGLVADHRLIARHGMPPCSRSRPAAGAAGPDVNDPSGATGSRGRPSTRSPTTLRWISLVPAKIDAA